MGNWNTTEGVTIEELTDADLPESLRGLGIDNLDIEFRSIGYYQPMSMYGGSDRLGWPEDSDDERTMISVIAFDANSNPIPLTEEQQNTAFDHEPIKAKVDACELTRLARTGALS